MTRLLLYGLLAAVGGAALILLISQDPGYIIVSIGSYTIEMSFWFGLALFCFFAFLIYLIVKWAGKGFDVLASSVSWISESRSKRIEKRTSRGLQYFIDGNWRAAKKDLLAAAKLENKPGLQYLAAANSAFELGEEEETRFLLQQVEKAAPENEHSVLLTKARLALRSRNYAEARALLRTAASSGSEDIAVLKLLKHCYRHLQCWSELLELLPKLKAGKCINEEEGQQLETEAWQGQINIAMEKAVEMNSQPLATFEKIWKGVPTEKRKNPLIVETYVRKLLASGFVDKASEVLILALKTAWDSKLVFLYGDTGSKDSKRSLAQAEAWLVKHPADPSLLYILGRLAKQNQLWGKSKEYFEKSLALKQSVYCYAELAELLAELGEHKESVACYQKGIQLSAEYNYFNNQ